MIVDPSECESEEKSKRSLDKIAVYQSKQQRRNDDGIGPFLSESE